MDHLTFPTMQQHLFSLPLEYHTAAMGLDTMSEADLYFRFEPLFYLVFPITPHPGFWIPASVALFGGQNFG